MKLQERILEPTLKGIVKIHNMQFGFVQGRSTVDAIYIV